MVSSKLDSLGAMQQPPTHSGMFDSKATIASRCLLSSVYFPNSISKARLKQISDFVNSFFFSNMHACTKNTGFY